jgi:hypothetical protein
MKTRIILIAVITIIGIGLLTAFKQSEGSRKYLTMTVVSRNLFIIDEKGVVTEKKIPGFIGTYVERSVEITKEINLISSKGYKFISFTTEGAGSDYIFEKE